MHPALRLVCLLALASSSLTACQHAAADEFNEFDGFENGPAQVQGEWRLAVMGGGITGKMDPVPAGQEYRLVFGSDSAYARYDNGKLVEASTFQARTQPSRSGMGTEQLLILKTTNTYGSQPMYYPYYITALTSSKLEFATGTGCGMSWEYVRVKATSPLPTASGH